MNFASSMHGIPATRFRPVLPARRSGVAVRRAVLPRSFPDWVLFGSVLWFGSYAYLYVYGIGGPKPLYSYFALIGATGLWVLARLALQQRVWTVGDKWLVRFVTWCALYLGYVTLTFAVLAMGYAPAEPWNVAAQFVAITIALLLLMVEPRRLALTIEAFAILAAVGAVVNLFDFIVPTFSTVSGRAAGLYANPTISGNFVAMAMVAGLAAVPRRLRQPFAALCGLGVLVTFSRESWLVWGIAFVWAAHQGLFGGSGKLRLRTIVGALIGGGMVLFVFSGGLGQVVGQTQLRAYLNENTLARIGISSSVLSGESADERRNLISHSLAEGASAPLFGKGFGYTQDWGAMPRPHNTFLLLFVEGGVIGLALGVGLVVLLWRASTGVGRIVTGLFIVTSFFSHNNLEQPALMLMVAFALAHGALVRHETRRQARAAAQVSSSEFRPGSLSVRSSGFRPATSTVLAEAGT